MVLVSVLLKRPIEVCLGDARSLLVRANVADIAFIEDTLGLFAEDEMTTVVGELKRILRSDGRLCVVTMELALKMTCSCERTTGCSNGFRATNGSGVDRFTLPERLKKQDSWLNDKSISIGRGYGQSKS